MATTYHDPDGRVAAYVLQGRTDGSGVEAEGEHVDGQDLRLLSQFLTAGVKDAAAFQVRERQAGATMSVDVGSGTVGDVAVIAGADPLQGNYIVGWPEAVTNVAIGAADLLNPRIDEIYLVVQDHTYDHNGANIVPRLAVRDGTPSSSPTPPGPDASWKAYLLLATVDVGAGVTEIEDGDITDERQIVELAAKIAGEIPRGVLGFARRGSNITGLTGGPVDLPDLSVQVTVPAGRLLRAVGYVSGWTGPTQGEEADFMVREGNNTFNKKRLVAAKDGVVEGGSVQALIRPSAGTHTYKLSFEQVTGSSNWTLNAPSTAPAYFLVEDIGADPNA